jgi:hypothetical protein
MNKTPVGGRSSETSSHPDMSSMSWAIFEKLKSAQLLKNVPAS